MTGSGVLLARAASRLVGSPFRLHGRDPVTGLDCVGLVDASLRGIGRKPCTPTGYGLRNSDPSRWLQFAEASGFHKIHGEYEAGDLLLLRPSPGQLHLIIVESRTHRVHAHAGLRRVVRQPLSLTAAPIAHWRLSPEPEGTA